MAQSMGKTAQTMAKMNKQMDPQKMAKTLAQFERENMKMEMSGEMMDDAMGEFSLRNIGVNSLLIIFFK